MIDIAFSDLGEATLDGDPVSLGLCLDGCRTLVRRILLQVRRCQLRVP